MCNEECKSPLHGLVQSFSISLQQHIGVPRIAKRSAAPLIIDQKGHWARPVLKCLVGLAKKEGRHLASCQSPNKSQLSGYQLVVLSDNGSGVENINLKAYQLYSLQTFC